jgi:hypothetical protein
VKLACLKNNRPTFIQGFIMAVAKVAAVDEFERGRSASELYTQPNVSLASAVSWSAIAAGAAAAAALSLILLILGTGLGLSAVSPWADTGIGATTFGVSTILWVTFTQLVAAALGGYLTGRLRTRWVGVHADEVYFRDTAHGLLAWAVASLATAALLTSVIGSIVNAGAQAGATISAGVATTAMAGAAAGLPDTTNAESEPMGYLLDSLFRKDIGAGQAAGAAPGNVTQQTTPIQTAEVARIFLNSVRSGPLPAEDVRYVGQVVAQSTGLNQADAEQRVAEVYTRAQTALRDAETAAREAADSAREASAYGALWLFISLLIGAFAASFAATYGGRRRDISSVQT